MRRRQSKEQERELQINGLVRKDIFDEEEDQVAQLGSERSARAALAARNDDFPRMLDELAAAAAAEEGVGALEAASSGRALPAMSTTADFDNGDAFYEPKFRKMEVGGAAVLGSGPAMGFGGSGLPGGSVFVVSSASSSRVSQTGNAKLTPSRLSQSPPPPRWAPPLPPLRRNSMGFSDLDSAYDSTFLHHRGSGFGEGGSFDAADPALIRNELRLGKSSATKQQAVDRYAPAGAVDDTDAMDDAFSELSDPLWQRAMLELGGTGGKGKERGSGGGGNATMSSSTASATSSLRAEPVAIERECDDDEGLRCACSSSGPCCLSSRVACSAPALCRTCCCCCCCHGCRGRRRPRRCPHLLSCCSRCVPRAKEMEKRKRKRVVGTGEEEGGGGRKKRRKKTGGREERLRFWAMHRFRPSSAVPALSLRLSRRGNAGGAWGVVSSPPSSQRSPALSLSFASSSFALD